MSAILAIWTLTACQNQKQDRIVHHSTDIMSSVDSEKVVIAQLPYISSNDFTSKEMKAWTNEIYNIQLSAKHFDWENPTSGGALHINRSDEIEVYQSTLGFIYPVKSVDESEDSFIFLGKAPEHSSIVIKRSDMNHHVGGIGLGNPNSVLITSEYDLKKSKSLGIILDEIYKPGTQVFYLKRK